MMNKLILDGVEYNLSDSLVAKLKEEIAINDAVRHKPGAFDRVDRRKYFFMSESLGVVPRVDVGDPVDDKFYSKANYCCDEELMKQRALHEKLNRLLWRYSETHGGDLPWSADSEDRHWCISIVLRDPEIAEPDWVYHVKTPGAIYFQDQETTQSAIEEVVKPFLAEHPEFKW